MKCQSVACLWSAASPLHRITAAAVLNEPPTLYTGGSDGSVVWWSLSGDHSKQEVWPMAMLCGHAAAIADLCICTPVVGHGEIEPSRSNVSTVSDGYGALLSACTDGVLCIWSRGSGHCKRRRKLPPWVGTPCLLSPLPTSQRYVCIACSCVDSSMHAQSFQAAETLEGGNVGHAQCETGIDKETHHRRAPKYAVVIVDSCTLNIVQTVFHGGLSIGPLKFMSVFPSFEDGSKQTVVMADALGKVQLMVVVKESDQVGGGGSGLHRSASSGTVTSVSGESLCDGEHAVSVAAHGDILALIFGTRCVLKRITDGAAVGEISLVNSPLCDEEPSTQAHLIGGMFLQSDKSGDASKAHMGEGFVENFAIWSSTGAAIIYKITGSGFIFDFLSLCEIPAMSRSPHLKTSVRFCQLNHYLFRLESICSTMTDSSLWKPYVTIWSVPDSGTKPEARISSSSGNYLSMVLGEGGFPDDWIGSCCSLPKAEKATRRTCQNETNEGFEKSPQEKGVAGSKISNVTDEERIKGLGRIEQIVSSSMVLSEDFYAPYAVVYGFYSGEIEVIQFGNSFPELNSANGSVHYDINPHARERSFSGHTGAVLCLAAHRMVVTSNEHSFVRVLLSGSLDCTVRIWDLDTGNLVSVMHHHVAPVRQIILPPPWTDRPWSDCFLSVGEDSCMALASLKTLRVERMFPGHSCYPAMVAWDSARGYVACLCRNLSSASDVVNVLYLWDAKTGARERIIRGTASNSMFDHFCRGISRNTITGNILGGTTSASSLLLPVIEDAGFSKSHATNLQMGMGTAATAGKSQRSTDLVQLNGTLALGSKGKVQFPSTTHVSSYYAAGNSSDRHVSLELIHQNKKHPIKCYCPFPGIASLKFDLSSLMSPYQTNGQSLQTSDIQVNSNMSEHESRNMNFQHKASNDNSDVQGPESHPVKESLEGCLLRFSLSFLHLWGVDLELDQLLTDEMNVCKPEGLFLASGVAGDRGSLTLTFPGLRANLELWKSSSEFCAMRSLTIVSLAQRLISLSHSSSAASSALAAFYTRNFAEKVPDIKPPLLQLLVSFWQDSSEHVRMAARSLFHCAAPRAIPHPLCGQISLPSTPSSPVHVVEEFVHSNQIEMSVSRLSDSDRSDQLEESVIVGWLDSFEIQDWISCIGGTAQDAMASHIIEASALAVWYPSVVKAKLAPLVVNHLIKLVMAVNDLYSSTAAELLAEGMDSTWKACIGSEIPRLVGDIFFQIECLSGASANNAIQNQAVAVNIRETLVGILLPSLAMADISGFLNVIERQIWATSSDSPVHLVSLTTLIRVVRGSPKPLAPYLDKVVNFILQTMDPGNSVMRKICLHSSMTALREVARVFPMVGLNEASTRLAVGDAVGDIHSGTIRVYDIQSVTKIKVLDASGPPGLPSLLAAASETTVSTGISALSFSPDGEGLVAFSEHGLMIRWWSLGTAWWEKLSRSVVPVQCTKLIFVPPWEGFSPNSSRSSIMASIVGHDKQANSQSLFQERTRELNDGDSLKLLLHNLDLSYRLEWNGERRVVLTRHGQELGSFQF